MDEGLQIHNYIIRLNNSCTENVSRHKQPKTLEVLAISGLAKWICQQAEWQMSAIARLAQKNVEGANAALEKIVKNIRICIEYNVPWMVHDFLVKETIKILSDLLEKSKSNLGFRGSMGKFVSQMNVIVKMAEVLFTKNLTILSIDNVPKMLRSNFYNKLHTLNGLVYLNLGSLSGGWKTADMEGSIIKALKDLHCLKQLVINYDCTDNILMCLVNNCKKIEKLDVSSSKSISNESINIITKLKCLKFIQLYRTFVTLEGFAKLLINCKTLEDIGRCDDVGRVLEYIDLTNSDAAPFQLTTFVSRYATNNQLQLAIQMCPLIRNMTVYHHTLQNDLMVLIELKDLCELNLLSCDFYADQVKQVLQIKGCNIRHLHLEHVDQIDLNALMYISQMCPLLEDLTLYNCTLIPHTSLHTKKIEILPFRNLKRFTCVAVCTDEQLSFVLNNCINVEYIHIGTAIQFADEFVDKLLDKNPLIHLKELRILQSDFLTMATIERIIESCMSLEILVELESWSLLKPSDREYVRNYIKINNLNIDTAPQRYF